MCFFLLTSRYLPELSQLRPAGKDSARTFRPGDETAEP